MQDLFPNKTGDMGGTLSTPATPPVPKQKTLVLVNDPGRQQRQDFEEIQVRIAALAPEIDVPLVPADQPPHQLDDDAWRRPCLVVSFGPLQVFRPRRGFLY